MTLGHLLFYIVTALWLVFEVYLHIFFNRKITTSNREKSTKYIMLFLFMLGTLGGRYASPGFRESFIQPLSLFRYISILFLIAAFLLRLVTVIQLGKSFSVNLGVQPDQELRTDSVYKHIRHPGYLSLFLGFCGVGIAFYHPVGSSMCIIFSFCGIYIRIREEEKILLRHFGESYRDYMRSTKMIIPFVL